MLNNGNYADKDLTPMQAAHWEALASRCVGFTSLAITKALNELVPDPRWKGMGKRQVCREYALVLHKTVTAQMVVDKLWERRNRALSELKAA